MNIIRAQFMHQHKNKAMYEREILLGSPALIQHYDNLKTHLEFDMLMLLEIEHEWMYRWLKSGRTRFVTRRSLRFLSSDGVILYELPKRPLKVNILIPENFFDRDIPALHICCVVEKDEVKELSKIFFPKYFED